MSSKEHVFVLAGGRWFIGETDTVVVKLVLENAREMFAATQPVVNHETGATGIRCMSGALPIEPAKGPTTICVRAEVVMRGSECPEELLILLRDAEANEVEARSGLTVPKGGLQ